MTDQPPDHTAAPVLPPAVPLTTLHRRADRIRRRRALAIILLLAAITAAMVWANIQAVPRTGHIYPTSTTGRKP
jgi:ferric-dicitrate binding protein FerR (iron transport regulator)